MAEQYCTRMLYYFLKLVLHRRGFFLGFCVLNFVFSLVATLANLLVIRTLMKASTRADKGWAVKRARPSKKV